jgi:hypothetical protein
MILMMPWRRITLHLSHIFFTLVLTFIPNSLPRKQLLAQATSSRGIRRKRATAEGRS